MNVNPKVTASAIGGTVAGGAAATIIIWVMQGGFGMAVDQFTPERVVAITAICTGVASFISGYLKKAPQEGITFK